MKVTSIGAPSGGGSHAILPKVFPTVIHLLADTAARWPEREALVAGAERLNYRETLACVAGFARELARRCGDAPLKGERVAILLPNGIDICIATYAAHAAGAQVVPLNPLYTERELEAILADAAPAVLIHDAAQQAAIGSLVQRLRIPHSIAIETGAGRLAKWKAEIPALPEPLPSAEDLAFVQYTGGTTGRSKGVNLKHGAVAVNISQREGLLPTGRDGERILCVMPLFHTYALAMGLHLSAYCGGTLVILPRYHPQDVLRALAAERITIFPGSPTIFSGLMGHEDFGRTDFSRLHTCYSGSAPLPAQTLKRWEKAVGCAIHEGYGQTEAGPVLTYNPLQGVRKPGSVGIALARTEVQIVDAETGTRILGAGERGEIRARGPQIMSGYRNLPQETAEALRGGWLYTGDIGEFDADGYLFIRDRKKDMVIVGGYNVYPREVEDVLFMHPAVQDAAALGTPDAYRGEVMRAFVVLRPGASATVENLLAHCATNLAKYKVPVSIAILDALPRTAVNKTDRKALRDICSPGMPDLHAYSERTLPQMLVAQGERHRGRPLLTIGETTWTFGDAASAAARRAGNLAAAGIGPGDRVALLLGNRLELMEMVLACGWIGAVAVPINTAAMGPQIRYYLHNSGARLLAIEADLLSRLDAIDMGGLALERVWAVGDAAIRAAASRRVEPLPAPGPPAPAAAVKPGDTLAILYTSGTTGSSKGVMCPHAQYYWWGVNSIRLLQITADDVLCTTLPLFHINALGTFAQALLSGARMVLHARFSASAYWAETGRSGATVVYLLGAMVPILLAQPRSAAERDHRVRIALGPGAPPDMIAQFGERTGVRILEGYGSTETNFVIGATLDQQKRGTMGRVRPGFQARVVDADDAEVAPGAAGELVLRADEPFAFATGYFGMPEKTLEAWRNLWFHTGDRVILDADGNFRFLDRLKDAIRRRGENISSYEVEQALLSHPAIETAAVFPVRSELAEDEVMAAIVLKADARLDPIELMRFCEPRIPYFAIPRFIEFLAELPRTENGKVQKFKLRERGRGDRTWDREAAGYVLRRR